MEHHVNLVRQRLVQRQCVIGAKVDLPSPDIVEIVGRAGYDFAWIDCEHGSFGLEMAVHMMRAADAAGVTPIVRVPDHRPSGIGQVLDAGAKGVLVPCVNNAEEARALVRAAKYQTEAMPNGRRGACPRIRASGHQTSDWPSFSHNANQETMLWVLVETPEGVKNIREIADVEGVDAIMPGPFDLSVSMGKEGNTTHPEVVEALESIVAATVRAGKESVAVLLAPTAEGVMAEKRYWEERGCRIFNVISDRRLLSNAMVDLERAMRSTSVESSMKLE